VDLLFSSNVESNSICLNFYSFSRIRGKSPYSIYGFVHKPKVIGKYSRNKSRVNILSFLTDLFENRISMYLKTDFFYRK